jgi:Kef-type K+ transport system membrane component KefB
VTDLSGLVLLSFLTAYFDTESTGFARVLPAMTRSVAFLTAGLLVGPPLVRRLIGLTRRIGSPTLLLVFAFSYLLLVAQAARAAGLAMVIGAYAAGIAFSRLEDRERLEQEVRPLIQLFRPLFFVLAGASISFASLDVTDPDGRVAILFTATLIVAAVIGKTIAAWRPRGERDSGRAIPWAMVARGGMGFVFAEAGVRAGFVPPPLYSALALTLTATTVIGAAGLRIALSRSPENGRRRVPE